MGTGKDLGSGQVGHVHSDDSQPRLQLTLFRFQPGGDGATMVLKQKQLHLLGDLAVERVS